MKIVIQRVKSSNVIVENKIISEIEKGLVLLVCFEVGDALEKIEKASQKILNLRVFSDENGKMNLNIKQIHGEILSISQFTLSWDGQKGNRPSFDNSLPPLEAKKLYAKFIESLSRSVPTFDGEFGAHMNVNINNDGPVTFVLNF